MGVRGIQAQKETCAFKTNPEDGAIVALETELELSIEVNCPQGIDAVKVWLNGEVLATTMLNKSISTETIRALPDLVEKDEICVELIPWTGGRQKNCFTVGPKVIQATVVKVVGEKVSCAPKQLNLIIGATANVPSAGRNPRLRASYTSSSKLLASVPLGSVGTILDGPMCNEGLVWFQVRFASLDLEGWMPESSEGIYGLEVKSS